MVRRSGGYESGPGRGLMLIIILLLLTSAFVTQIIGIAAIFGGFLIVSTVLLAH